MAIDVASLVLALGPGLCYLTGIGLFVHMESHVMLAVFLLLQWGCPWIEG